MGDRCPGVAGGDKTHSWLVTAQGLAIVPDADIGAKETWPCPMDRSCPTGQGPRSRLVRIWRTSRLGARPRGRHGLCNRLTHPRLRQCLSQGRAGGEKPSRARLLGAETIGEASVSHCEMGLICALQGGQDLGGYEREGI